MVGLHLGHGRGASPSKSRRRGPLVTLAAPEQTDRPRRERRRQLGWREASSQHGVRVADAGCVGAGPRRQVRGSQPELTAASTAGLSLACCEGVSLHSSPRVAKNSTIPRPPMRLAPPARSWPASGAVDGSLDGSSDGSGATAAPGNVRRCTSSARSVYPVPTAGCNRCTSPRELSTCAPGCSNCTSLSSEPSAADCAASTRARRPGNWYSRARISASSKSARIRARLRSQPWGRRSAQVLRPAKLGNAVLSASGRRETYFDVVTTLRTGFCSVTAASIATARSARDRFQAVGSLR